MLIVFRADASTEIGSGHVMRCLALAQGLRARGAAVSFVCRPQPGDLIAKIHELGFAVDVLHPMPTRDRAELPGSRAGRWQADAREVCAAVAGRYGQVDWLIADHYEIDAGWELEVRAVARRVLVIDDLADRPHHCDLLLDQNVRTPRQECYEKLVNPSARKLLGLRYLLLREEFARDYSHVERRDDRALLFFGGADHGGMTVRTLQLLRRSGSALTLRVLVGASNPAMRRIDEICREEGHELHVDASNVAELISGSCFAIATCGFFAYELMALRTPALLTAQSDITWTVAKALEDLGVAKVLAAESLSDPRLLEMNIAQARLLSRDAEGYGLISTRGVANIISEMETIDNV